MPPSLHKVVQQWGLWKTDIVGKQSAIHAVSPINKDRTAEEPQPAMNTEQKPTQIVAQV